MATRKTSLFAGLAAAVIVGAIAWGSATCAIRMHDASQSPFRERTITMRLPKSLDISGKVPIVCALDPARPDVTDCLGLVDVLTGMGMLQEDGQREEPPAQKNNFMY